MVSTSMHASILADPFAFTGCLLCDEVSNQSPLSIRLGLYRHYREQILLESENFLLIPDISPLTPRHSLLITKKHYPSFALTPRDLHAEFDEIKKRSLQHLNGGSMVLFEHGSPAGALGGGACIHHAHLHFVGVNAPVEDWMGEHGEVLTAASGSPFLGRSEGRNGYLYFERPDDRACWVWRLQQRVPCQFFRRRIAEYLGNPDWHWESVFSRAAQENSRQPGRC